MTKPVLRWTIGSNVNELGFTILERAISQALAIYGEEFRWYVCHNQLSGLQLETLQRITAGKPITLYEQNWSECPIPDNQPAVQEDVEEKDHSTFSGSIWKVCPARLDIDSHEIIVDNDVVFQRRLWHIDQFLKSQKCLVLGDPIQFFGRYAPLLFASAFNSGMIGLPPGYNFANKIKTIWERNGSHRDLTYSDEQGLLTYTLICEPHILVPKDVLIGLHKEKFCKSIFTKHESSACAEDCEWEDYSYDMWPEIMRADGFHFLEANRYKEHKGWKMYTRWRRMQLTRMS